MQFKRVISAFLILLIGVFYILPCRSVALTSADAISAYRDEISRLSADGDVAFIFADVTWDGEKEGIIEYQESNEGSGRNLEVLTYSGGKTHSVLYCEEYGVEKVMSYKKGGIDLYGCGHGGEWYRYFKKKAGVYIYADCKARSSVAGGSDSNGSWRYYIPDGDEETEVTVAVFKQSIKGICKGKKKTVSNWKLA